MIDTQTQREAVVAAARGWLGTPFHDHAGLKGVGVDCAHLLGEVFFEAGVLAERPFIESYSPQFMLHSDTPLFEQYVVRLGGHEIPPEAVGLGDIVLYKIGRSFAHGAVVVEWPGAVVHAFKVFGFVAETPAFESELLGRAVKFYSPW